MIGGIWMGVKEHLSKLVKNEEWLGSVILSAILTFLGWYLIIRNLSKLFHFSFLQHLVFIILVFFFTMGIASRMFRKERIQNNLDKTLQKKAKKR